MSRPWTAKTLHTKEQQLARLKKQLVRVQSEIKMIKRRASLLSVQDIASAMGISHQTVWRMLKDRTLKGFKISPGRWGITRRSFARFQDEIAARCSRSPQG
jgi:predicted DNA-binding transcriptional regulator AlpA